MPTVDQKTRAYGAAHFALVLDGAQIGMFKSLEGGNVKTDFVKYQNGAEHGTFYRLGRPKYEDIKVTVGMSMGKAFYEWLSSFFRGEAVRKNGSMLAGDFHFNERARRDFAEAMITEVGFPKLDGNDKAACFMNVTISPETVTYKPGSGGKIPNSSEGDGWTRQKTWAACNFAFRLDGFEDACKRVTKVDAFTIKQKPIEYASGGLRHVTKTPGRIEYPNIAFYVPEVDAQKFIDHHTKHVIGGEVQASTRLKGELRCLDATLQDVFVLEFQGADIFAITHDKNDASSEEIRQVKIEICVESMTFKWV